MMVNFVSAALTALDVNLMITVTLSGLLIVFCVLTLLTLIFRLFGFTVDALGGKGGRKKDMPAAPAPAPVAVKVSEPVSVLPDEPDGLSDEIITVIAAAIAACDPSANYVIRSVKRAASSSRPAWNAAGVFENTRPF